jgi:hypothetical protein
LRVINQWGWLGIYGLGCTISANKRVTTKRRSNFVLPDRHKIAKKIKFRINNENTKIQTRERGNENKYVRKQKMEKKSGTAGGDKL